MKHEINVTYTTDDDGIWVRCGYAPGYEGCGWEAQVPGDEFWPTPEQLVVLANGHRAFV
jgi:hypothetical protein